MFIPCNHDSKGNIDGVCRVCGKVLRETTEVSGIQSALQARKVLETFAIRGNYRASAIEGGFMIYQNDGWELTVKKKHGRRFDIVRRVRDG